MNNAHANRSFDHELMRRPGLFRRWEIGQVIEPGRHFHVQEAGETSDGTPLFVVYRREPADPVQEAFVASLNRLHRELNEDLSAAHDEASIREGFKSGHGSTDAS